MRIPIIKDGWVWILGAFVPFVAVGWICRFFGFDATALGFYIFAIVAGTFMVYFHRNPLRIVPPGDDTIVSGADGVVRRVENLREDNFLKTDAVRISVFLSPMNVHVNRLPMAGQVSGLGYTAGRHLLTINDAASEVNEHSTVYIEGARTRCVVRQIVGPVVRRVVYWLEEGQKVAKGDVFGMMKFGSRLDIYLPKDDVDVLVKKGDRVQAGLTVVATLRS